MNNEEYEEYLRIKRWIDHVGVDNAVAEARAWWRRQVMLALALVGAILTCVWLAWRNWFWVTNTPSGFFVSSLIGAILLFSLGRFVFNRLGPRVRPHYVLLWYPFVAICWLSASFLGCLVVAVIVHYILLYLGFVH